jgi:hypothetical protein
LTGVAALPYWRLSSFYLFYFALLGSTAPFLALYFDHLAHRRTGGDPDADALRGTEHLGLAG